MKADVKTKIVRPGLLKKLWGYITREEERISVRINARLDFEKDETGEVKFEVHCMNKAQLIDAIASGSKLTKADAGRALDSTIESIVKLRSFKAMEPEP